MSSCLESFEVGFDVVVVVRDAEGAGDALVEGSAVALEASRQLNRTVLCARGGAIPNPTAGDGGRAG